MIDFQAGVSPREFLQVSGLSYSFNDTKQEGERVITITMNGKEVNEEQKFSIATNNYVASHLKDFFGVSDWSVEIKDTEIVDRDAFIAAVRKAKNISSTIEGRIVEVTPLNEK